MDIGTKAYTQKYGVKGYIREDCGDSDQDAQQKRVRGCLGAKCSYSLCIFGNLKIH
jgi:hypothetical protein